MSLKESHDALRTALEGRLSKYSSVRNDARRITIYSSQDPASPYVILHDPETVLGNEFFLLEASIEKRYNGSEAQLASLVTIMDEELKRLDLIPRQTTKPNELYHYYNVYEK